MLDHPCVRLATALLNLRGYENALGTIDRKWLLVAVGCITSFSLVFVCFELLQILVQSIDKYPFSVHMKIHIMVPKIKKQNNVIFNSLVT